MYKPTEHLLVWEPHALTFWDGVLGVLTPRCWHTIWWPSDLGNQVDRYVFEEGVKTDTKMYYIEKTSLGLVVNYTCPECKRRVSSAIGNPYVMYLETSQREGSMHEGSFTTKVVTRGLIYLTERDTIYNIYCQLRRDMEVHPDRFDKMNLNYNPEATLSERVKTVLARGLMKAKIEHTAGYWEAWNGAIQDVSKDPILLKTFKFFEV